MVSKKKLENLRAVITENLRVQRDGKYIEYINIGTALQDACAKQNHAIFARRGCGKTLLLHHSAKTAKPTVKSVYLNCEDFKSHSFPNVLIEILMVLFRELEKNLTGWFGKKKESRLIIQAILVELEKLKKSADTHTEEIRRRSSTGSETTVDASAGVEIDKLNLKLGAKNQSNDKLEIERSFSTHREKLQELDNWFAIAKRSYPWIFWNIKIDGGNYNSD